jgi:flagellar P-ring protein precursor FlgI
VIPGGETTVDDTTLDVEEETARAFVFDTGVELSDIVDAINALALAPQILLKSWRAA